MTMDNRATTAHEAMQLQVCCTGRLNPQVDSGHSLVQIERLFLAGADADCSQVVSDRGR